MNQQTLTYTVNAKMVSPGITKATAKEAEVEIDTSAGQSQTHMGPADLFVTAFAACVLKNVERFSKMLHFSYEGASISVIAERQERPPRMSRISYELQIVTDAPERLMILLHRNIKDHGTIYNTVAAVCDVSGRIVTVPTVSHE